jgi:hypothetical protein
MDLFDVTLLNPDGSTKQKITDIYVDSLVPVIDDAVEKVQNYAERVKQTYCL